MNSIEMVIRTSLHSLRHASQVSLMLSEAFRGGDDLRWSWGNIQREFLVKNAEVLFHKYQARLQHSLFVLLCLLNLFQCTAATIAYFIMARGQLNTATLSLTLRAVSIVIYLIFLIFSHKEQWFRSTFSRILASIIVLATMLLNAHGSIIYYLFIGDCEAAGGVRPTYNVVIISFIMLSFPKKYQCVIAGIFVTVLELFITGICFPSKDTVISELCADAMFYFVGGAVGFYIRFLMEMMNRKAFLDRRECLEAKTKLKFEKQQEETLLLSVLPNHLAERVKSDIRNVIERIDARPFPRRPFHELYIERHSNVSILYADIVNSMMLAAKLEARDLVGTLNELFARFDESAESNQCIRIKLLGDCYYCVSGVPNPDPDHADNSVQQGLDMIDIIRTVREERQVDVDMRIGVHTGQILCGLIGSRKWQYDIWSKDALIASHMEQAGTPGHVHITDVTYKQLRRPYFMIRSQSYLQDTFLSNSQLEFAYLISPTPVGKRESMYEINDAHSKTRSSYMRRPSMAVSPPISRALKKASVTGVGESISTRKKVVLDQTVTQFRSMRSNVNNDMEEAIDKMALSKKDQWCNPKDIQPFFLTFLTQHLENDYLKQPDPLFKYYYIAIIVLLIGTIIIHSLVMSWTTFSWIAYSLTLFIVLLSSIITWAGYLYSKKMTKQIDSRPYHYSQTCLTRLSHYINQGVAIRIFLWFITSGLMLTTAMMGIEVCEFTSCHLEERCNNTINETVVVMVNTTASCHNPWYYTFNAALAMTSTSVFLKIHYLLKLTVHSIGTVVFCFVILKWKTDVFSGSVVNYTDWALFGTPPALGHCYFLIILLILLHMLDRQVEYVCRLDFIWKKKLWEEKEEARLMGLVNKMLLMNILPVHVANHYLSRDPSMEDQLYYEEYNHAAVMFASIPEYTEFYTENLLNKQGLQCLQVLNEIICDFDELLCVPTFGKVEKIKTVGSTYMAATGLQPGRGSHESSEEEDPEYNVIVLVKFASAMMEKLAQLNLDTQQDFRLRIGIALGPVIAGVVGISKPQYDIWGDTVNTASRMDSTGVIGRIHITKEVAKVLLDMENSSIKCESRGEIFVKGKGMLSTYMVKTLYDKPNIETTKL